MSVDDDVEDFFEKIRKMFKLNSDMFDLDMFFLPETMREDLDNPEAGKEENSPKGFKVSYHFDSKEDKPDIKIEGNLNKERIKEYFNKRGLTKNKELSDFLGLNKQVNDGPLDAEILSMDPNEHKSVRSDIIEPFTEVNDCETFSEIVLDVPGITRNDVILSMSEDGQSLVFSAKGDIKDYSKNIMLPFKSTMDDYKLEVNNGIAILRLLKCNN